jgi:hypothetical protein
MNVPSEQILTGGCLCGALRYEARGAPQFAGHCYCSDCRKASGSGFIPFMMYPAAQLAITGESRVHETDLGGGRVAHRNSCSVCHSLVFGGVRGESEWHTIYAGTLDEPQHFVPTMAIYTQGKPDWALIPPGLAVRARGTS